MRGETYRKYNIAQEGRFDAHSIIQEKLSFPCRSPKGAKGTATCSVWMLINQSHHNTWISECFQEWKMLLRYTWWWGWACWCCCFCASLCALFSWCGSTIKTAKMNYCWEHQWQTTFLPSEFKKVRWNSDIKDKTVENVDNSVWICYSVLMKR